jgi:cytochrome c-type biogenesis protein CcmH
MITFALFAGLLVVVTLALLLPPLLRSNRAAVLRQQSASNARSAANLAILRDQLAELQQERAEGTLAEADLTQAESELKRRLLEEATPQAEADAAVAQRQPARKTAVALVVLLPLLAFLGYGLFGNTKAFDPQARVEQKVTAEQVEGMVQRLAEKLKANPEDGKGWIMLARSYKVLQRYAEASEAYSHAGRLVDNDPVLLADWAETAARAAGGKFAGQPEKLLARALKLNPDEPQALMMGAVAASQRGDHATAVNYWEKLLPMVEPGSEDEQALKEAISQAKLAAGKKGKSR